MKMIDGMLVAHRLKGGRFSEGEVQGIIDGCGRDCGHTTTMLRGVAQVVDLTEGPVRVLFASYDEARHAAGWFCEIAKAMAYESVVLQPVDVVTVNGVVVQFRNAFRQQDPLHKPLVTYEDKGVERERQRKKRRKGD